MPPGRVAGMVGWLMVLVLLARGAGFIRGMIRSKEWCSAFGAGGLDVLGFLLASA